MGSFRGRNPNPDFFIFSISSPTLSHSSKAFMARAIFSLMPSTRASFFAEALNTSSALLNAEYRFFVRTSPRPFTKLSAIQYLASSRIEKSINRKYGGESRLWGGGHALAGIGTQVFPPCHFDQREKSIFVILNLFQDSPPPRHYRICGEQREKSSLLSFVQPEILYTSRQQNWLISSVKNLPRD